jgi:hypothetical protein
MKTLSILFSILFVFGIISIFSSDLEVVSQIQAGFLDDIQDGVDWLFDFDGLVQAIKDFFSL